MTGVRWIVFSLLLVNALLFGWRWWLSAQNSEAGREPAAVSGDTRIIELLPEGSVIVEASPPSSQGPSASLEPPPATEPELSTPVDTQPNATADEPPAAQPLLVADASPSPVSESAVPVPPAPTCAWTDWMADDALPRSDAEVIHTEQREQELSRSYLVFIPGKGSRERTLARLAELKAIPLEAAYLNRGPQEGGISLGLFSKPESMQVRLSQLRQAGIADAVGIERIRTESQQRQLLRWLGDKTPTAVTNQPLIVCDEIAPTRPGQ